jgi:hypothetical protein
MKKIKITESQAKLLGIKNINENEPDSGLKSVGTSVGEVIIRVVISGENVPKLKDRIFQIVSRHDKDAKLNFFEVTNKIVGQMKEIKLEAVRRDLKSLDPNIIIENKPLSKTLVKVTREQYDRLIKENNKIDVSFKKEFAGKNIQKIDSVSEEKFNISKPDASIPNLNKNVGNSTPPVHETEGDDNLKKETLELIKYLYRKSENLSPFWGENGLKYDEICDNLLSKNLIISKNGKYEVAKTTDNPQEALKAIESELTTMIKPESNEKLHKPEIETETIERELTPPIKQKEPELETLYTNNEIAILKGPDNSLYVFNYYGINKKDFADYASLERKYVGRDDEGNPDYEYGDDFDVDSKVVSHYVNDKLSNIDKGEGSDSFNDSVSLVKIDEPLKQELINLYDKDKNIINILAPIDENQEKLSHDVAKEKITSSLPISRVKPKPEQSKIVAKLADLKAKEEERRSKESTSPIGENDGNTNSYEKSLAAKMFDILSNRHFKPVSSVNHPSNIILNKMSKDGLLDHGSNENGMVVWFNQKGKELIKSPEDIISKYINNSIVPSEKEHLSSVEEITGAASSGAFTGPLNGGVVKKEMSNTPIVGETTVAGAGNFQYDTPGLANVGRNGEFKNGPKTKAQSKTQYANGSFVELNSCTKLNNNKEAQNGKCSQGGVDGVVKQKKTNGSIISPSLGENTIYEMISKKTGKTIEEVKSIINSKK